MPLWWSHGVNTIKGPRGLCVCLSHSQFSEREKENRRRWWIVGASQASERVGVCDTFSRWPRSLHDQSFVARASSCHIAGAQSFPILRFVPTRVQNPTIGFDDRVRSYPFVITLRKRGRGELISTNCKVYAKNRLSAICAKNLVKVFVVVVTMTGKVWRLSKGIIIAEWKWRLIEWKWHLLNGDPTRRRQPAPLSHRWFRSNRPITIAPEVRGVTIRQRSSQCCIAIALAFSLGLQYRKPRVVVKNSATFVRVRI